MRPISCLQCLLPLWLLCQPWLALADWEKVDENHLAVVYINPDKIRASSVFPQAWHLIDLNEPSKAGVKSRLALMEYDCHEYRRRTLAFASKAEAMGEGKTLFTSTQSTSWKPVSGDTVGEKVIAMLCGRHAKPHGKGKGKDDKAAAPAKDAHGDGHGAPPSAHGDAKPSH
ncbi:MAG: hypothetical protein EXR37_04930 [Limnohabitans sp.]|nr:hypothetical protein [Limnohabitans sp.]